MADQRRARPAELIASHPDLREVMSRSPNFAEIKRRAALQVDDQVEYIVKGDTIGDEQDLFVEALVRGADASRPEDEIYRALYLELSDEARALIRDRTRR